MEWLSRGELRPVYDWLWNSWHLAAVNLLLVLGIMAFTTAILSKPSLGILVASTLLLLAAVINHAKLNHLHQPFLLTDLLYVKQMISLLPVLNIRGLSASLAAPLGFLVLAGMAALCRRGPVLSVQARVALITGASAIMAPIVLHRDIQLDVPAMLATENAVWDQRSNTMNNGFLLSLALNAQPAWVSEPGHYSEEYVSTLMEGLEAPEGSSAASATGPISLVLFMSESFSDLRHVKFQTGEVPLANFQRLVGEFPGFRMASPSFGGNTSHVEFEALTGIANYFLPDGAVPYDHFISEALPSLASILRRNGYRTLAVHPYHPWFWNRETVFPRMGFEDFISLPDFGNAPRRGWFVSDEALVDRVMAEIRNLTGPYFVYALSMQNHGVYDAGRYGPNEVPLEGPYPEQLRLALQTYITGLKDADLQLARLLDFLDAQPDPVMVLFCGDHLPGFGKDYAVYRESGAVRSRNGGLTPEEHFNMADVPCLWWSNRREILDGVSIPQHLSTAYIPSLLLHQMGIEMPPYLRYMRQGMHDLPVIHRQFFWHPGKGVFVPDEDDFTAHSYLDDLEILQYDVLWGEGYSLQGWGADA